MPAFPPLPPVATRPLPHVVRQQYQLDWYGLHGITHRARVLENGMRPYDATPNLLREVVALFALLLNACRDDGPA